MQDLQRFWVSVLNYFDFPRRGILLVCLLLATCLGSVAFDRVHANANLPLRVWQQPSPLSPLASQAQTIRSDTLPMPTTTAAAPGSVRAGNQASWVLVALVLGGVLLTLGLVRWRQR